MIHGYAVSDARRPVSRHNRFQAVARLPLIEQDEIVEDRHERIDGRDGGLLVDRGRRRIVPMVVLERPALLLRGGRGESAGVPAVAISR